MQSSKRSGDHSFESNKKKCLTIDLDYWTAAFKTARPYVKDFLQKCIESTKRFEIIDSHELVLDYIDNSFVKVVNVDYHNDIIGSNYFKKNGLRKEWLNDGTWGNYLPKSVVDFVWYYPLYDRCIEDGEGICRDGIDDDSMYCQDYPINVTMNHDCRRLKEFDSDVLVICKSEDWDYYDNLDKYMKWIDDIVKGM